MFKKLFALTLCLCICTMQPMTTVSRAASTALYSASGKKIISTLYRSKIARTLAIGALVTYGIRAAFRLAGPCKPNITDIKKNSLGADANTAESMVIYAHGFAAPGNIEPYIQQEAHLLFKTYPKEYCVRCFSFPDARGNLAYANLAQHDDIKRLKYVIEQTPKNIKHLILHGVSRGAATIIVTLGTYPDLIEKYHIKAIVIDSPFADPHIPINNVVKQVLGRAYKIPGIPACVNGLIRTFYIQGLRAYGPTPLTCLRNIPTNLPILHMYTHPDRCVPIENAMALKAAFEKHTYTDIAEYQNMCTGGDLTLQGWINHGNHCELTWNGACAPAVNAFLRKHQLPSK